VGTLTVSEIAVDAWSGAIGLPLIGAALHPFLGVMIQRATKLGVRLTVMLGVANLITFAIFAVYLDPDFSASFGFYDGLAVLNGLLFFWGQWFSIQSVRNGDLVVHSSALGFKVLIVAVLSASVGLEKAGPGLMGGAVLATAAVYLVTGATVERFKANAMTLWLTLLACVFFATNDFLTGWKSQEVGGPRWLMIMMFTAALLSLGMLLSRWKDVRFALGQRKTGITVLGGGLALEVQALVVNLAFSMFREPALSNIAYSTRGVMAVFFVWALVKRCKEPLGWRQLLGAILMVVALGLVLI
jgi:hypothetical protein